MSAPEPVRRAPQVQVAPGGATLREVGAAVALRATVLDENGVVVLGRAVDWRSLNPAVATVDPATGMVTAVASGQAVIAATTALGNPPQGMEGYALVTVAVPGVVPAGAFRAVAAVTGVQLNALWGAGAVEVYAVGAGATVLRYDGQVWGLVPGVQWPSSGEWSGVWGTGEGPIFVVGADGGMSCEADGTNSPLELGTNRPLYGVWGASPRDVFVVGVGGTIRRFDGTSWVAESSGTAATLRAVWGTSATNVYAVGDAGTVVRYDGRDWTPVTMGTSAMLMGIWGTAPDDIFIASSDGLVLHHDGTRWGVAVRDTTAWYAVWGTSSSDVYAAGLAGTVLRYDGAAWSRVLGAGATTVRGLWGTSGGDVFAVGDGGVVLQASRGGGARLVVASMPRTAAMAGAPFALEVRVVNAAGQVVAEATDSVTVSLGRNPAGAQLLGTTGVRAEGGIARFTDLRLTRSGSGYTFMASAPGLGTAQSLAFSVTAGPPWGLEFTTQPPETVTAAVPLQPAVVVAARDTFGNRTALPANVLVTLRLEQAPLGAQLLGDTACTAEAGVVVFPGVLLTKAGGGYVLRASAPSLQPAVSGSFSAKAGPLAQIVVDPEEVVLASAGEVVQLTVRGADTYGNDRGPESADLWRSLNPAVVTADGAGAVRAVASGQTAVEVRAGTLVAYATATVAIPNAPPVRMWTAMQSGTRKDLNYVWAYSAQLVNASGTDLVLRRFDGVAWADPGLPSGHNWDPGYDYLGPVAGVDAEWVYIAYAGQTAPGFAGFLVRRNGGLGAVDGYWGFFTDAGVDWRATPGLWVASPRDQIAAQRRGRLVRVTAGELTWLRQVQSDAQYEFKDIWGTSRGSFHVVGSQGKIVFYNGSSVVDQSPGGATVFHAVWGASGSDVFAVGTSGAIFRFDGTSWSPMTSGTTVTLRDVWGTSATDVYAVGEGGTILRFDGTTWSPLTSGTTQHLYGIFGAPTGEVFVVGAGGTILLGTR